jgi:hypothetical protein
MCMIVCGLNVKHIGRGSYAAIILRLGVSWTFGYRICS